MSAKAIIVRQGTYTRSVTVALPDGLTAADLVAALNSKKADQVGDFFICPDTFSARIELNQPEFPEALWEVLSAEDATSADAPAQAAESMKEGAQKDAVEAAQDSARHLSLHQINTLNQLGFELNLKGDIRSAGKMASVASALYQLAGGGDSREAVWLFSLKSFNCSTLGQHKAAWRYGRLAVDMARRVLGEENAEYGLVVNNIAEGQIDAGSYGRAEKMLNEGMAVIDKAIENKAVDLAWAANVKADAMQNYQRLLQLTGRG
ncbi:MAG: hypothetical protein P4L53_09660 [Candidatus Obscuribacterales bacterium]|nr:hypothetical protein [Candidatus Obscuribacterales bacterium]